MEPTKYDIERAFYRILENGDEAAIARELGHSAGYVSQLYSPDNERESTLVRTVRELRALRRVSIERASHAVRVLVQFIEQDLEGEQLCVIDETKKLKQQVDEWENAEMARSHISTRIEETRDVHLQSARVLNAHAQELRRLAKKTIDEKRAR